VFSVYAFVINGDCAGTLFSARSPFQDFWIRHWFCLSAGLFESCEKMFLTPKEKKYWTIRQHDVGNCHRLTK